MIETRLASLELKLVSHAEELKFQVSERVLRIQNRLECALRPFQKETFGEPSVAKMKNVVAFNGVGTDVHHLHVNNAKEALNDLNQTLRLTREHLEALSNSVNRMKQSVATR